MAWTNPRTWVTAESVLAIYFNSQLRDNLNLLTAYLDTSLNQLSGLGVAPGYAAAFSSLHGITTVLYANSNPPATNTTTGETDLMSYTFTSNFPTTSAIRITAWGTTTNSVNAKTVKLSLTLAGGSASTFSASMTVSQANNWLFDALYTPNAGSGLPVLQIDGPTNAQFSHVRQEVNSMPGSGSVFATGTVVKCTGTGGATAEITQLALLIEALNI